MSNRELPMMPWFPKEFAAATCHWAFAERAAYRSLLDVQWEIGVLPDEPWRLAQAIGMPLDEFEQVWPMVRTKFVATDTGIVNERLEEHRVKALRLAQGRQRGAQSANAKRWGERSHSDTLSDAGANHLATRSAGQSASAQRSHPSPSPSSLKNPPKPPNGGPDGHTAAKSPERQRRDQSRAAWVEAEAARRGNDFDGLKTRTPLIAEAIRIIGGFNAIGMTNTDRMGAIRARFRETYEHLLEREGAAHADENRLAAAGESAA